MTKRIAEATRLFTLVAMNLVLMLFGGLSVASVAVGCKTSESVGIEDEELSTGEEIQNVVSFPFRVIGNTVIYPLKALFYDLPKAIGDSLDGELGDLEDTIESGNEKDKLDALFVLSRIHNEDAWELIVEALKDESSEVRKAAVLALAQVNPAPREAAPFIRSMLANDRDEPVRISAAFTLGRLGDAQDIAILRSIYFDNDNQGEIMRSFALLSMAKLGDITAMPEAIYVLGEPDMHAMWHANAVLALGNVARLRPEYASQALVLIRERIKDDDERIMISAVTALGIARDFAFMIETLRDAKQPDNLRKRLLYSLGEHGGDKHRQLLINYFTSSKNKEFKMYAAFGLAKSGYRLATQFLIEYLDPKEHPDPLVRLWALGHLYELTGQQFSMDYSLWLDWWKQNADDFVNG